ncbi:MAG: 5-methyltetrahydropteroyltriglutamate--homocysteine S-methyltransferase [Candidatus Omnitrophica bacterium]|nr:5-methyltetrahydropteroyltriglutamate--homocysteine S-methyltransferase [Candidatus Omnitrophota bacterium]
MKSYAYGFPRLGKRREFKKSIEDFWESKITKEQLASLLNAVEEERICFYKEYVDNFPIGEFTYYDNVFDTALIFGVYNFTNFETYFDCARGKNALELRKYFDTNYHYLVPSIKNNFEFKLSWNKPLLYFKTFFSFKDNPVFLIGPYTFLKLSKLNEDFDKAFDRLCISYKKLFDELKNNNIHSIHLEEPAFCLDVTKKEVKSIARNYKKMIPAGLNVNLITYYESVDFLPHLYELPLSGIGLDFIAGRENLDILEKNGFPKDKKLICGIVDARNPLRSNIEEKVKFLETIKRAAGLNDESIVVSNSSPLIHLPVTLDNENNLNDNIKSKISFAKERLYEINLITQFREGKTKEARSWGSKMPAELKAASPKKEFNTLSLPQKVFANRKKIQQKILNLPLFPVTTIGSFPQDKNLRKTRFDFVKGNISLHDYDNFIRGRIFNFIEKQEEIGLDVLTHGEFERTDMVEFFAKTLRGFITTQNGWVISYGTRAYRPPIISERIKRENPLTIKETFYAQSIAPKPVKGILTGPITILAWSYNLRNDPLYTICFELAQAINCEAKNLAENEIKIIQIDEPAIKEFAPLKNRKRDFYYSWAVRSFNIASHLAPEVQVHTHLCYSEFSGIINWINKMNFDVLTIEAAREGAKILDSFKNSKFNRAIGPGVWDIHSKYPADDSIIRDVLNRSIKIFGAKNVWINPDCGLKTRKYEEVEISLKLMVKIAKIYRSKFKKCMV